MKEIVTTKNIFILIFSFFIISSCSTHHKGEQKEEKIIKISYKVYQIEQGWGYTILMNDRPVITQERIPAIAGNKYFTREEDARKVAKRVIQKLKDKKSPSITQEELKELGIQFEE